MKKSVLSLAALVLISASSMNASALSTSLGGYKVTGCNPHPQAVFGNMYAAVVSFFGF